jgi:hypothetical protein
MITLEVHRRGGLFSTRSRTATDEIYPPGIGPEDSNYTHSDGS